MTKPKLLREKRETRRFDLKYDVEYRVQLARTNILAGHGRTLNICSGGILFSTEHDLPEGRHIEVVLDWPAKLDGSCHLQLVVNGPVLRSGNGQTAVQILRYQFKTRRAPEVARIDSVIRA